MGDPIRIVVDRSDLSAVGVEADPVGAAPLADGQVRLACDVFGLSANNISYARAGEWMGYWAYFPIDADRGCIPTWGFANVIESTNSEIEVGDRLFGYLPMASHFVVTPSEVNDLTFQDAQAHRVGLHAWYNRYYRCDADPLYSQEGEGLQAVLWALFLTGWELAAQLAPAVDNVVVSSASSKTATSLAYALQQHDQPVNVVGLTSERNADVVRSAGIFDSVLTYGNLDLADIEGTCAYVDTAGNASVTTDVHAALGDRLVDSVIVGGTHGGAGGPGGELVGPAPHFFFIPDVADASAANEGASAFHQRFADAFGSFAAWSSKRLVVDAAAGSDGIVESYRRVLGNELGAESVVVLSW